MIIRPTPNGTWTYDFQYRNQRYRGVFKTKRLAFRAMSQKRAEVDGRYYINERLTFRKAAQLFFEKHGVNKASRRTDEGQIKVLNELFGQKRLEDITPIDIENMRVFLYKKGLKSGTVDHYHALVKVYDNMAEA